MNLGKENETIEFKKTTGELKEAIKSICAMLNKRGFGTIYFGVLSNGEIEGQNIEETTLREISRRIYEHITPQIIPSISEKIIDGKSIIEVTFSGADRPYSDKGIYYIRVADENRILPINELRQMFEYSKNNSWDEKLTNFKIKDINLEQLFSFYNRATASKRIKDNEFNAEKILSKLGLLKNGNLTNAAYYLFSKHNPITLKLAIFATDEKLTFLDIKRVEGNIYSLINEAYEYIIKNIRWKSKIIKRKRTDIPEIPLRSLREIICNSFAHARYNALTQHEIITRGGASLPPRRLSLPALAAEMRSRSAYSSTACSTAATKIRNSLFDCGSGPGSKRFMPVLVSRDQLLCLPDPFTPAKGFSASRQVMPWRSATFFIISIVSWLWSAAMLTVP